MSDISIKLEFVNYHLSDDQVMCFDQKNGISISCISLNNLASHALHNITELLDEGDSLIIEIKTRDKETLERFKGYAEERADRRASKRLEERIESIAKDIINSHEIYQTTQHYDPDTIKGE